MRRKLADLAPSHIIAVPAIDRVGADEEGERQACGFKARPRSGAGRARRIVDSETNRAVGQLPPFDESMKDFGDRKNSAAAALEFRDLGFELINAHIGRRVLPSPKR
jgi:hypothetical protein